MISAGVIAFRGAGGLECEQLAQRRWRVATRRRQKLGFADPEAGEIFLRQVDTAPDRVVGDVPQDVGELQGQPQLYRVLPRPRVRVLEDLDGGQAHRRGDALAVDTQAGERRVARRREVHPAAGDDVLE